MTTQHADIPQSHGQGQTIPGLLHVGVYREQRRNVVRLCDADVVPRFYDVAEHDHEVSCKKCIRLMKNA